VQYERTHAVGAHMAERHGRAGVGQALAPDVRAVCDARGAMVTVGQGLLNWHGIRPCKDRPIRLLLNFVIKSVPV
jgi:hypothetical protein